MTIWTSLGASDKRMIHILSPSPNVLTWTRMRAGTQCSGSDWWPLGTAPKSIHFPRPSLTGRKGIMLLGKRNGSVKDPMLLGAREQQKPQGVGEQSTLLGHKSCTDTKQEPYCWERGLVKVWHQNKGRGSRGQEYWQSTTPKTLTHKTS